MENVPLIDVSFEDDFLIPSSSQGLGTHASLEAEKRNKAHKKLEDIPDLSDSPEQNQKRSDRYQLRKSLAWDSAFFTNEGILNPEELAVMNSTYSKSGISLPGIQEELIKSSESTTTLESDSRALEHLEVNLFENGRVSNLKTLNTSNHSRKVVHSDRIKEQKKPYARSSRSLEKIVVSSQIKLKPPTASKSQVLTRQQQVHISKDRQVCPSNENGELKPLIKPTKVSCRAILLPASLPGRKPSVVMTETRSNTGKPLPGAVAKQRSLVAFSKPNESPGITRRTTLLTKSKTPKCSRNEYTERTHHQNFVKSSLSLSRVSPSSSIDTVASESSSSTTSFSTKLGKSLEHSDVGSLASTVTYSSSLDKYSGSLSQSCICDRTKSNVNSDSGASLAKPSGLRMPRPTVGYFDKEKSLVHGSTKTLKPTLQSNLSKSAGGNLVVGTNKMRSVNLPAVRDRGPVSAVSKQVLKSSEVQEAPPRIENQQEPSSKVKKVSSETATNSLNISLKDEVHMDGVSREHVPTGEQKTHYGTHFQEDSVKMDMNPDDRETGKDDLWLLKDKGQSKMHQIKDQCAAAEKLAEAISCLSLSDAFDV